MSESDNVINRFSALLLLAALMSCQARRPSADFPSSYTYNSDLATTSIIPDPVPTPPSPPTVSSRFQAYTRINPNYHYPAIAPTPDDLTWEMRRLRRNADQYDSDEYRRRLRRLQNDTEDMSAREQMQARDSNVYDDAADQLRRMRRDIDFDPPSYYRDSDDYDRRLKRMESDIELDSILE